MSPTIKSTELTVGTKFGEEGLTDFSQIYFGRTT